MTRKNYPQRNWTQGEIRYLKHNYLRKPMRQIAPILNRSYSSVQNQSRLLHLYEKQIQRKIKPLTKLSETEKAYIAGFLDGEGSINIRILYNSDGVPYSAVPRIDITNSDEKVIAWIADLANWGKWEQKVSYHQKLAQHVFLKPPKKCWTINIVGRPRVQVFLSSILPYLRIKKLAAIKVLEFYRLHAPRKPYPLKIWKILLEIKELIDSRKNQNVESRQRLAQFIKELESKT